MRLAASVLLTLATFTACNAAPPVIHSVEPRATQDRYVFAHFMLGFVGLYTRNDWTRDIALAHSKGIDGFALNCDGAAFNAQKIKDAYAAAEQFNTGLSADQTPFQLFISPDFVHFSPDNPGQVASFIQPYLDLPAQFKYDNKPFVSTFQGEGTDWKKVGQDVGKDLYVVPYYYASQKAASDNGISGLFSWKVWPGESENGKVFANITTASDENYLGLLEAQSKTHMAPVSPWFYAHLPSSTGYPKNYHLYSDTLWTTRWSQILDLGVKHPDAMKFVEIITWNDWTESSSISPFRGGKMDDGVYRWADLDHTALMDVMVPYIRAFKAGQQEVTIGSGEEGLVWWYRPTLKSAVCDSDIVGAKPAGWEMAADSIFVAAMTTGPAEITLTTNIGPQTQSVDRAGIHTLAFPMIPGKQSFSMSTTQGSAQGVGAVDVSADCYNGAYNFNILSGSAKVLAGSGGLTNSPVLVVDSPAEEAQSTSTPAPSASSSLASSPSTTSTSLTISNTAVAFASASSATGSPETCGRGGRRPHRA